MAKHIENTKALQESLTKTATSPTGYFSIQHMIVLKSGESAELIDFNDPAKAKWGKAGGKNNGYLVQFNGKQALLSTPDMTSPVDLLKAEGKKYILKNGLIVRISFLKKVDLKVWLHNPEREEFKSFKGFDFFPFKEAGVIRADFVGAKQSIREDYVDSRSEKGVMYVMGMVNFKMGGKPYSFKAYSYGGSWEKPEPMMIFFKDLTSGKTTYGGGRVVDFDQPPGPWEKYVYINFNQAYNFLCEYSVYYNCPLMLTSKIEKNMEYGQKVYSKK